MPTHLPIQSKNAIVTPRGLRGIIKSVSSFEIRRFRGSGRSKKNRGSRCHNLGTNLGKPQIRPRTAKKHRKVASFCSPLRSSVHGAGASGAAGARWQQPHRLTRAREKAIRPHPSADSEQNGVFACLSRQRYLHLQQRSPAARSSAGFAGRVRRRRGVVHYIPQTLRKTYPPLCPSSPPISR